MLSGGRFLEKGRKNPSQIALGFLLLFSILGAGALLYRSSPMLCFFWISGNLLGYVLQRGRFCFVAAFRDPLLTGSTSLSRALLLALALTTTGFFLIKQFQIHQGIAPDMSFVVPVSLATLIGSFLFGMGSVIAGGCASGTLMRVGEGSWLNVLSLIFFIIGGVLGAHHMEFWNRHLIDGAPRLFLPDFLGWGGALLVQLAFLWLLYRLARFVEARRKGY